MPSQKTHAHCLVAACLTLKPKPNGSNLARCHASQVYRHFPDKHIWTSVIHCSSYVHSPWACIGLYQSPLASCLLIIAPQHWRCSASTSFAWVPREETFNRLLHLFHTQYTQISLCLNSVLLGTFFFFFEWFLCFWSAVSWHDDGSNVKFRSAHGGLIHSWRSYTFSLSPISNDCSITFLVFGMI